MYEGDGEREGGGGVMNEGTVDGGGGRVWNLPRRATEGEWTKMYCWITGNC